MASKEGLLFGTAGIPLSSKAQSTKAGIERIRELGLDCMEVEFVLGVRISSQAAEAAGEVAAKRRVKLSAHAPYYVNLNAREPEKVAASRQRILQTARITSLLGGKSIVFHAAYYMKDAPDRVHAAVKENIEQIVSGLRQEGNSVLIRPETTGKQSQFGTLGEVLQLSAEIDGVAPAIDFSHLYARTGAVNSYNEFTSVLRKIEGTLGREALDDIHIHASGIEYGPKGEIRHLAFADSDFNYIELLQALKDFKVNGMLICESPSLEEDALLLQRIYREL